MAECVYAQVGAPGGPPKVDAALRMGGPTVRLVVGGHSGLYARYDQVKTIHKLCYT